MVYVINKYNGTILTSVSDRTVNATSTSLRLPGRDYESYGELIVENLVWMLEHFSGENPPLNPVGGQIWYNPTSKTLQVYDATSLRWLSTGKTLSGDLFPPVADAGQTFYHTSKKQLFVYDVSLPTTLKWKLIGPVGATDLTDPVPGLAISHTDWQAFVITDTTSANHNVLVLSVAGVPLAVWSPDASFTIAPGTIPGFDQTEIEPGLNLQLGTAINGVANQATLASDSQALNSVPGTSYMRRDQSNTPTVPGLDLGSVTDPFGTVYANTFVGNATTSSNATLANTATNALNLNNQPGSFYQNADNINSGTLDVARLPFTPVNKAGDTMTGTLTLAADPASGLQAATKQYVDNRPTFTFTYDTTVFSTSGFSNGIGVIDFTRNYFDVFPPAGKTMANLAAFMASTSQIAFNGRVDDNDTLICRYEIQADRVRVWAFNTEQRALPAANYLAIWS